MEVVLEGAEGMPEGGLLSIKVGQVRRQAPVGKVGQSFRFSSSEPLMVELLMPAAPPQLVMPQAQHFEIHFGHRMKVQLQQREVPEPRRPTVDLAAGLPAGKMQMAREAAAYLEEHDMIRALQDVLHGLLVTRPDDPHGFAVERLRRAKRAVDARRRPPGSKVEILLSMLERAHENLRLVLSLLPIELTELLESTDLAEECRSQFRNLDVSGKGRLAPSDLQPLIMSLSAAARATISEEQCRRFCGMFDSNQDGVICLDEFSELVRFVVVVSFLESPEGREVIEAVNLEEGAFKEFLWVLEHDRARLPMVIRFLPAWLVDHITGEEFVEASRLKFEALDTDRSGVLEAHELLPVVRSLSEAHPLLVDTERCKQFARTFSEHGDGVITRGEFLEFAQFLTVMSFLSTTKEGKRVNQRVELSSPHLAELIERLRRDPSCLPQVMRSLPKAVTSELMTEAYARACLEGFDKLDRNRDGVLDPVELHTLVCGLMNVHPFRVDLGQCQRFTALFDRNKNGVICKAEFVALAQYITVMGFLHFARDHEDLLVQELVLGREEIRRVMEALRYGVGTIQDVLPFLPEHFVAELSSADFVVQCIKEFTDLDKDRSGLLEPQELAPVITALLNGRHWVLTEQDCQHFVELFDSQGHGAISKDEFVSLARFMMIMAFLGTEEGGKVESQMVESASQVEELVQTLEKDRAAAHKVVPLLPQELYKQLTSDAFVLECRRRFAALDRDRSGLPLRDLVDLVMDLGAACAVSPQQCARAGVVFELDVNGRLQPHEFLDFVRFVCVVSFLRSPKGLEVAVSALEVLSGSQRVDELIASLVRGRRNVPKVIPHLPAWLAKDLLSDRFVADCLGFFGDLDKDGNGALDPKELFSLILTISKVHQLSLDMVQCKRFAAIFDEDGTGMISKDEFVEFSRFLLIMGYLSGEEAA